VLRCRATDEQVVIDAADDAATLLEVLGDGGASKVVTTHQHWDHHRALKEVADATGAVVVAGAADADAITEQTGVAVDDRVADGDLVEFGDVRLEVIHLVGHTPGSIALLYDDPDGTPHLWTGDSLFPGGVGNTFGDAAAFRSLLHEGLRPPPRRDLVLPRTRRRLDPRRRAPAPRGVGGARLVTRSARRHVERSVPEWARP
jgi:glyoxylase-like metal-dependent hydrolase (beta-lactamase superfamily II)